MIAALIIAAIVFQIMQWRYSKKCIDSYKLIAQEWRETAELYRDEITLYKTRLPVDGKASEFLFESEEETEATTKE